MECVAIAPESRKTKVTDADNKLSWNKIFVEGHIRKKSLLMENEINKALF